jgi:hypothetical protein
MVFGIRFSIAIFCYDQDTPSGTACGIKSDLNPSTRAIHGSPMFLDEVKFFNPPPQYMVFGFADSLGIC